MELVVVISDAADVVACRANRHPRVRAAVVASPDHLRLLVEHLGPNVLAINPYLYAKIPYDPVKDFAPITLVGISPLVAVLHPSLPAKDVRALITLARARPGQVLYGSSGNGSVGHMAVSLLELMTGTKFQHVPYKGTAPMLVDVMSGQLTFTFGSALGVMPHVKSGKVRALAVSTPKRLPALPDVPPVAETLPGFDFSLWGGYFAPRATPDAVVQRLSTEINRIVADPALRARLEAEGSAVAPSTPQQFEQFVRDENAKYAQLVKATGAQLE